MKTEIEVNGFEIEIEQNEDGTVEVKIERDDEVIEEITLDPSEYEGSEDEGDFDKEGDEDVKSFDEFGGEEAPDELPEPNEDEEAPEDDAQLESFDSFVSKK